MIRKNNVSVLLLISVWTIICIFPLVWVSISSIKNPVLILSNEWTFIPTLDNYRSLLTGSFEGTQFFRTLLPNSVICALFSAGLTIFVALLAGYSLARFLYPGRKPIGFIILLTRMLPPIGMVIPLFLRMAEWKLLDTKVVLILVYTALNIPLATWMLKVFIEEIPREIEQSAMIDGCSRMSILFRIVLPLASPGIAAVGLFSFILAWNDFTLALFLTTANARTLPLLVQSFQSESGLAWGPMCASATLVVIPCILFVVFTQKYIIKGLTLGAIK